MRNIEKVLVTWVIKLNLIKIFDLKQTIFLLNHIYIENISM